MERSLYPDGAIVQQRALLYTEQTKAAQIRATRTLLVPNGGRLSGLELLPTADSVTVTLGKGLCSNGELVDLTGSLLNMPVPEVDGETQIAYLAYTEIEEEPLPTESGNSLANSRVTAVITFGVLPTSHYEALPSTSSDYTQQARDRTVVLGELWNEATDTVVRIVTVPGFLSTVYSYDINQPGIEIVSGDVADAGTATVSVYTTTNAAGQASHQLAFASAAVGDSNGTIVAVTGTGEYTVTSSQGHSLVLFVNAPSLPLNPAPIAASVTITERYTHDMTDAGSVVDARHRGTEGNPHNTRGSDLGGAFSRLLPSLFMPAGSGSQATADAPKNTATTGVHASPVAWDLAYEADHHDAPSFRVYTSGTGLGACITYNAYYRNDTARWIADDITQTPYQWILGANIRSRATPGVPWTESDWTRGIMALANASTATVIQDLLLRPTRVRLQDSFITTGSTSPDGTYIYAKLFDIGLADIADLTALNDTVSRQCLRFYFRVQRGSVLRDGWTVTLNGKWDQTTETWVQDDTSYRMLRLDLHTNDTLASGVPTLRIMANDLTSVSSLTDAALRGSQVSMLNLQSWALTRPVPAAVDTYLGGWTDHTAAASATPAFRRGFDGNGTPTFSLFGTQEATLGSVYTPQEDVTITGFGHILTSYDANDGGNTGVMTFRIRNMLTGNTVIQQQTTFTNGTSSATQTSNAYTASSTLTAGTPYAITVSFVSLEVEFLTAYIRTTRPQTVQL